MQHINNDMDDLFRRAGEEYPLDTRGADWEKIARELNGAAHAEKTVPQKSDRRLLWLLVLLPFSLICNQYFGNNSKETAIKEDQPVTVPLVIEQNKERRPESNRAIDRLITRTGPGAATVKDQSPRLDRKGTTLQKEGYDERIKQQRPTGRAKNKVGLNEHIVEASTFLHDRQITAIR